MLVRIRRPCSQSTIQAFDDVLQLLLLLLIKMRENLDLLRANEDVVRALLNRLLLGTRLPADSAAIVIHCVVDIS